MAYSRLGILRDVVQSCFERGKVILKNLANRRAPQGEGLNDSDKLSLGIENTRTVIRRFSLQEVCDLLGVSRALMYKSIKEEKIPNLPSKKTADGRNIKAGYSIDQLDEIRTALRRRPSVQYPAVLGFLSQKGGVGKTTISWLFSHYMALQGYRVCMIDTDPQGSLSFMLGYRPGIDVGYMDTYAPFLLQDHAAAEEEFGTADVLKTLHYCVKKTHWPNIDVIPACNELLEIELQNEHLAREVRGLYHDLTGIDLPTILDVLRHGIQTLYDDYDLVIIDGTPSVNIGTMNVISACDAMVVPTPAAMVDYSSTVAFCGMLDEMLESYVDKDIYPNLPIIRFLLARYHNNAPSRYMEKLVKTTFQNNLLNNQATASDEIQKHAASFRSIYEIGNQDTNNLKALRRAREQYDSVFEEIRQNLLVPLFNGQEELF